MSNQENTRLLPELRFINEDGSSFPDWKILKLKALAKRQTSKNKDEKISRVLTNSAINGVVDQRDYFDKDIAVKGKLQGYYIVEQGDYVYNPRVSATAPVGPISKNNVGKGVMSPLYTVFRFNEESNGFYEQFFKSSKWHNYLQIVSNTGARHDRMSISAVDFLAMPIPYPTEKEQQKISDCLSSVNKIIEAENQKLESLKAHKKGLMQNLFPLENETLPTLRFSEFNRTGEWRCASVQSLIDSNIITGHLDGNHGALYPKSEEFSNKGVPYISANDFVNGAVDFEKCKFIPTERAKKFKKGIAINGDVLFAHNATVGPVAKLNTSLEFVILSTTATYYRCDNSKLLNDFLLFSLSSPYFVEQYSRVMTQSTRNQVPITIQRTFNLLLPPTIAEQQKLSALFSSINELISSQFKKVKALEIHKKGLMQQLFPVLHKVSE